MQYEDIRNEEREEDENADENEQEDISKTKSTTMSDSSLNQVYVLAMRMVYLLLLSVYLRKIILQ